MMTRPGTLISRVERVLSAILGAYPSPPQHVRAAAGPEVAHVDAPRLTDPHLGHQRLVYVAELQVPRLSLPHRVEQCLTAPLHPLRHGVEQQVGHLRWDVGAQ